MYYHYGKGIIACPLFRGCPLLRGDKCTITMGRGLQLVLCSEVVLFSEVTNVLSLWEEDYSLSFVHKVHYQLLTVYNRHSSPFPERFRAWITDTSTACSSMRYPTLISRDPLPSL